ncbi:uncharacterized protein METZ01_LOCUS384751, partial [marine metagenome]
MNIVQGSHHVKRLLRDIIAMPIENGFESFN